MTNETESTQKSYPTSHYKKHEGEPVGKFKITTKGNAAELIEQIAKDREILPVQVVLTALRLGVQALREMPVQAIDIELKLNAVESKIYSAKKNK
jgi:hypothetical protein